MWGFPNLFNLEELGPGQKALLARLDVAEPLRQRLLALGLVVPGTVIEALGKSLLGDPPGLCRAADGNSAASRRRQAYLFATGVVVCVNLLDEGRRRHERSGGISSRWLALRLLEGNHQASATLRRSLGLESFMRQADKAWPIGPGYGSLLRRKPPGGALGHRRGMEE